MLAARARDSPTCRIFFVLRVDVVPQWVHDEHMAPATTPKFIVCNIDGIPVGEYDSRDMAISACRDLALEAAHVGDTTNGYYIHDDEAFGGFLAVDVND